MKLATERTAAPDGRLVIVSRDLATCAIAENVASTLQDAIDRWDQAAPRLRELYDRLNCGKVPDAMPFRPETMTAPLPRAWQWLDGSAFPTHGALMQKAFDLPAIETAAPLMYQGLSHQFLGPTEDVPLPSEDDHIDFEGEFGVITGPVRMRTGAAEALHSILLAVQINDWSLRKIAPLEMKTGFGWIHAKPACSMAPVAVTLDELAPDWRDGRLLATLEIQRNGERFGAVPATEMAFGFHELIAHAARTRSLCAGTIIGSGTISSRDFDRVGSCCISERRAIEVLQGGSPRTSFLRFGERVRMQALRSDGVPLFGALDQRVVNANS